MENYTPHQARYFAEQIKLKRSESTIDGLASAMSGVKVDLNPHQVDAALFAMKSPLSNGALLADEVGLGKTIEGGLVLAQYWSERKRHILLIVPASLRMQWRAELSDKFYIDSVIMEASTFNKAKKDGKGNPFDVTDKVVICSYNFAARKDAELRSVPWDLVIMDEAHKLRNVYKPNNVTGNRLKNALAGARKKLLLTATPLQNNLLELYGLTSLIDDHVFGDEKTFREMYVAVTNTDVRNRSLRARLQNYCKRTLRSQVTEYVRYTNRIALLQEYSPSKAEEELYNGISAYLQTEKLYALPEGQRNLITMVLRKLLASSSFAISGTLDSLIARLEGMLAGYESELNLDDFDTYAEYDDEDEATDEILKEDLKRDCEGIKAELALLRGFAELAKSITNNSKGDNLLTALQQGFDKTAELGGQRKAVIFTESRRTQNYLFNLLSNNGYKDQIVFLNGVNNDAGSKEIYNQWKERHKSDGKISGSRTADIKAAIVEEFRDRASILIGTEAASEGINLQFCSIVVNYDLPWNPQRIEQRIGRCHRYGQKNDVVVINFLNNKNAADRRVYELLDQKFTLFSGVFGSSDEVLGSVESGVDFEKRIAEIYQKCKNQEDIQREFDELQEELADQINEKMVAARQSILENFDEEVANRLADCQKDTIASLDKFSQWMYYFFLIHGAERVEPLDEWRFTCKNDDGTTQTYNLKWKDAEAEGDLFLRKEDSFFQRWLEEAIQVDLPAVNIKFDHTGSSRNVSFFTSHPGLKGTLSIDKMSYDGIGEEEHLVYTVITNDGSELDNDLVNRLLELPGMIDGSCPPETVQLIDKRKERLAMQQTQIENANRQYYLDECDKLDAYSEELKDGLEREIKEMRKEITAKKKEFKNSTNLPLDQMLALKDEINKLEKKRKEKQRDLYAQQDKIDADNERLQEEMKKKLEGKIVTEHIMTISFEVV